MAQKSTKKTPKKMTPLMQQYWENKSAHPDKVLLFRMGDFFEMFHEDALVAAPLLNIALTQRNKKSGDDTPMCGVPHHSIAEKINRLLAAGHKVAICDQVEDPKQAKGLVKRAVTRVLSPGVVYDPETLESTSSNYICAFEDGVLAFLETSTGEAFYFKLSLEESQKMLRRLMPREVIEGATEVIRPLLESSKDPLLETLVFSKFVFSKEDALEKMITSRWKGLPRAAHILLGYSLELQGDELLKTLQGFEERELLHFMELSPTTIEHLELFRTNQGDRDLSFFGKLNRTKTAAGARLFKQCLAFPLKSQSAIEQRQKQVTYWKENLSDLKTLRSQLSHMGDIQRRIGKVSNPSCGVRDLVSLKDSIRAGLNCVPLAKSMKWEEKTLNQASEIVNQIERTLVEEPPLNMTKGEFIREGFSADLDELIKWATESQKLISELEAREREETGIPSLKVRYNQVFGFYIEVTNTHKSKVPKERYMRKQTLTNAERFVTEELQEIEKKVLSARTKRIDLEMKIFKDLKSTILEKSHDLLKLSIDWARMDLYSSFAWLSIENNYCRPEFTSSNELKIEASRHPIVELTLSAPFVPNDIHLNQSGCILLTGPNMAGKSTLMRQVALTSLLFQIGSDVPASRAELPIFDQIFTRIGASDSLTEGLSTFMVEMLETATMLDGATENSLLIVDEIGRGTSTYDGMALAQSILEYILRELKCKSLFATHYHELTELADSYQSLENKHMAIEEINGEIEFLHLLKQGPANRSYGVHVAKLAGMPETITVRASQLLKQLESSSKLGAMTKESQDSSFETVKSGTGEGDSKNELTQQLVEKVQEQESPGTDQLGFGDWLDGEPSDSKYKELIDTLMDLDTSHLTPIEALVKLDSIRKQAEKIH